MVPLVVRLSYKLKNYDWGVLGSSSYVSQLMERNEPGFHADPGTPYAELWVGVHPSGESDVLLESGGSLVPLSHFLNCHNLPMLPYLFKVLSVGSSLSIQVHPNKHTAEILHQKLPDYYPDSNHKPEMVIALTPFKALIGTRSIDEIRQLLACVPALGKVVVEPEISDKLISSQEEKEALIRGWIKKLLGLDEAQLKALFHQVLEHIDQDHSSSSSRLCTSDLCHTVGELFLSLHASHPYDVGCAVAFFMNIVTLKPGEALFMPPNVPHAYLLGDCVECMANSDNVVRLGLTHKFKDSQTLLEIVDLSPRAISEYMVRPSVVTCRNSPSDGIMVQAYCPGVEEFQITQIKVTNCTNETTVMNVPAMCAMLTLNSCRTLGFSSNGKKELIVANKGSCYFFPKPGVLSVIALPSADNDQQQQQKKEGREQQGHYQEEEEFVAFLAYPAVTSSSHSSCS